MDWIIETKNLSKKFGNKTAIDQINIQVEKGAVVGFLGPNGAGKTTTVRLLNGILKPTNGNVKLFGRDVNKYGTFVRSKCGVQTDTSLYEKLTATDNLTIWGKLYGMRQDFLSKRVTELLKVFDLEKRKDDLVGSYSKGMKQKLSIARALIHEPEILFLDEPTAGLDPDTTEEILEFIKNYVENGEKTVFLTSHRLEEMERVCDYITIIDKGKILISGRVNDLIESMWQNKWFAITLNEINVGIINALQKENYIVEFEAIKNIIRVALKNSQDMPKIINLLVKKKAEIMSVEEEKHTLKDVYMSYIPRIKHEV